LVQKLELLYTNTYSLKIVSFSRIQLVTKDTILQKASNTNNLRDARTWFIFFILVFIEGRVYRGMFRKKSKYKHVKINKQKYYFYKISWLDITADGGHATREEFDKFECSKMVSYGYIYKKILQIYEIGQERPAEDESVTIDLRKHKTLADLIPEVPRGLTKIQEEIWRLKNQKK